MTMGSDRPVSAASGVGMVVDLRKRNMGNDATPMP